MDPLNPQSSYHLTFADLERGLAELAVPEKKGTVELIVARNDDGSRETPARVTVTPAEGVPRDAWFRRSPGRLVTQIAVMRADVARLVSNGQPLSVAGDNLLVNLDLSRGNLPAGTRLRAGTAVLEVTPEPHNGCAKFGRSFGRDALRLTADPRYNELRLRGLYMKVVEPGEIAPGDVIEVLPDQWGADGG